MNGAELRIQTWFYHDEHVDVNSDIHEMVNEVSEFPITYIIDNSWVTGIMNQRQPVSLTHEFGPRPSMSFFMYNQDGSQAIARPFLDGQPANGKLGSYPVDDHSDMPKYYQIDNWDVGTNAVSSNFIYKFEIFKYWVKNDWEEIYSNDENGFAVSGNIDNLAHALSYGKEIKVGIKGVCSDIINNEDGYMEHEVFVQAGYCYYYTDRKLFICETHPLVRVNPGIPMRYFSRGWDFGWLLPKTDGTVAYLICDPYTLKFRRFEKRHSIRWFTR